VHQNATTPQDFIGMALAYREASLMRVAWHNEVPTKQTVKDLGALVNNKPFLGFRKAPAVFADGNRAMNPQLICRNLEILLDAAYKEWVTPEEFYQRFEEIHPFFDGNGRVGAIIYNWLKGSLADPVHPPAFKK
jgi:Fic/DOC family